MAGNTGKKFEELIKLSATEQGYDVTRLRDAGWRGMENSKLPGRRFTVKNICDFILFKSPDIYFVEAKSSKTSLSFARLKQQKELLKKLKPCWVALYAGYIVKINDRVFWITAYEIDIMQIALGKKSFNDTDAAKYSKELDEYTPKGKKKPRILLDLSTV